MMCKCSNGTFRLVNLSDLSVEQMLYFDGAALNVCKPKITWETGRSGACSRLD